MLAATRIEFCLAFWAGVVASHVFVDGQLGATNSAKDSFGIKFRLWPDFWLMISSLFVAAEAGIVVAAAFKLDGDHVKFRMPVDAAGLLIDGFAKNVDAFDFRVHHLQGKRLLLCRCRQIYSPK